MTGLQGEARVRHVAFLDTSDLYDDAQLRVQAQRAALAARRAALPELGRPTSSHLLWDWLELARVDSFESLWGSMRHALAAADGAPPLAALQLAAWGDLVMSGDAGDAYVRPGRAPMCADWRRATHA